MAKKILSLMTALLLLFGATHALAIPEKYRFVEEFDEFDFEVEIPEGALYKQNQLEGLLCLEVWYEDQAKPVFDIHVAFSEELAGKYLGEMTEEEQGRLTAMVGEDFSEPAHALFTTPSGNTILFTRETDPAAGDYASMVTVYKGFFFSLHGRYTDYSTLADEDFELMHQIIEGAWIIDTDK